MKYGFRIPTQVFGVCCGGHRNISIALSSHHSGKIVKCPGIQLSWVGSFFVLATQHLCAILPKISKRHRLKPL